MSDLAHVPGQRIQLHQGASLEEVFRSALKSGGSTGEPREPLRNDSVRSKSELQAVIDDAGIRYADCGRLSVALDWWNCNSNDPAWEVADKEGSAGGGAS
jgi:hypothetical protein